MLSVIQATCRCRYIRLHGYTSQIMYKEMRGKRKNIVLVWLGLSPEEANVANAHTGRKYNMIRRKRYGPLHNKRRSGGRRNSRRRLRVKVEARDVPLKLKTTKVGVKGISRRFGNVVRQKEYPRNEKSVGSYTLQRSSTRPPLQ